MKRSTTVGAALLICAVAVTAATVTAGAPATVEGVYKIKTGKTPAKKKYTGTVAISKLTDTSNGYLVNWTTGASEEIPGVGMLSGKFFGAAYGGTIRGVGLYTWCEHNGDPNTLCGEFIGGQSESTGGMPDHVLSGDNKMGKYPGSFGLLETAFGEVEGVAIKKLKGTLYAVSWTLGDGRAVQGVGIENKAGLWVAWGDAGIGLVVYKVAGKKLDGTWAMVGDKALGTEKLAR